ncbi:hypothetical protein CBS101457_005970 [Exobasidium rhododendri]|nr:hypothetical protein CBS101457_005970 [Exobasidium rhododendri]
MTDSILNNKRRLERHSRRDGDLQARARPVAVERKLETDEGYAADYVRRLFSTGNDGNSNGNDDSGDGDSSSSSTDSGTSGGTQSTDSASTKSTSVADGTTEPTSSSSSSSSRTQATSTSAQNFLSSIKSALDPATSSTSTTSSSTITPTSTRSTSTSAAAARTTSLSSSSSPSSSAILTTTASAASSTSLNPTTSVAFVTASASSTANIAAASSTESSSSSGVGAGPIIGIVAGSLAGIAIIAVIVGFLFKKFSRKEDPYEADPFDRDDFRRQSAMLPENFDSEDGHPSMSEHNNLASNMSPFGDNGYMGAGVAAGGMAAVSAYNAHNENGGPRPPSMFQRHINGRGAQYGTNEAGPQVGAIYDPNDLTPHLPPMAFGGSDPYSIAGVGRNHQMDGNLNNPYAHLDRSMSTNAMQQNSLPSHQQQQQQVPMEARNMYAEMNPRDGSNEGNAQEQFRSTADYDAADNGYNTTGRPSTAEGRSGTPDLPNVQQTYALGDGSEDGHQEMDRVASPNRMVSSPQHLSQDMYSQYQSYQPGLMHDGGSPPQQPLQVRNLLPNPHDAQHTQQAQRPMSAVSSYPADDEAAYGGVW